MNLLALTIYPLLLILNPFLRPSEARICYECNSKSNSDPCETPRLKEIVCADTEKEGDIPFFQSNTPYKALFDPVLEDLEPSAPEPPTNETGTTRKGTAQSRQLLISRGGPFLCAKFIISYGVLAQKTCIRSPLGVELEGCWRETKDPERTVVCLCSTPLCNEGGSIHHRNAATSLLILSLVLSRIF